VKRPICGSGIVKNFGWFKCEKNRWDSEKKQVVGCKFAVSEHVFGKKEPLTDREFKALLGGERLKSEFYSKKNKSTMTLRFSLKTESLKSSLAIKINKEGENRREYGKALNRQRSRGNAILI
jgi:hypothetical protein